MKLDHSAWQHAYTPVLPAGYAVRTYETRDKQSFFSLMHAVGWTQWDEAKLEEWQRRVLPAGWPIIIETTHNQLVASAMACTDCYEWGEQGGEVGWVATKPAYQGQGLGIYITAATVHHMLQAGYTYVHLYTEDWRLAALKIYLKLGFRPVINNEELDTRWQAIYTQLNWKGALPWMKR